MRIASWIVAVVVVGASLEGGARMSAGAQAAEPLSDPANARTRSGLQALYDFRSADGPLVKDRSGVGKPVDLRIADLKAVRRASGSLELRGKTLIRSDKAASKISDSIRSSGELTIEAWIRPANTSQAGPARIVTLSKNANERNFTLGQDGDRFEVRLRTKKTSANGIPALASAPKSLSKDLTQVVYTRQRDGRARIYLNGKQKAAQTIAGETSNWNSSFHLALANELTNDRPWQGTYFLVAVYNRSLTVREIEANFEAGAGARISPAALAASRAVEGARRFDAQIAPLLVRHCFECHDANTKEGGLDLSRKDTALAGGESGRVILPGKSAESLLWESVESDEMPHKRPPLKPAEKKLLREWIDSGAIWSAESIDPALYAHDRRSLETWVQRLTVSEYIDTVRSAVGVDVGEEARRILPQDVRTDGFSNTAYNLNVDLKHVEAYAKLAEIIVQKMDVLEFAARFTKGRERSEAKMRQLIARMGKWLLRGPLGQQEVEAFLRISTDVASAGGDYKEAVSYLIEAMLQSPRFIYRVEHQRDGAPRSLGDYELASRLSYIIWGAPPDQELMRAADAGELSDRGRVEAQVQRMLRDPRAVDRSLRFVYEWLDLERLDNLRPNANRFPNWNAQLGADMREETLAFFKEIVWEQQRPLADLLNAQVTYATPRLAKHYGWKPQGQGLSRYDLSSVRGRGGLLTQGSVLTIGGDEASMVTRGLFVLHDLLRGVVKDPPPCVNTAPVPTKPGLTQRGIAERRLANAACGGCHARFEPLAFGLEKFDGLGAFRDVDQHGNKLRDDGQILFPGKDKPVPYKSAAELMDLLSDSPRVRECLVWKVTQFAMGRPLVASDKAVLDKIHRSAQTGGGTYASLITAIVMSDLVQIRRRETSP